MGRFKNPWGKGSSNNDRWFNKWWDKENDLDIDSFTSDPNAPEFIKWIFNTDSVSEDNCAKTISFNNISTLGKNIPDEKFLTNGMELAVEFKKNPANYSYSFSREAQYMIWFNVEGNKEWKIGDDSQSEFTSDNTTAYDSCTTPQKVKDQTDIYHIYSLDRPGLNKLLPFKTANNYLYDEVVLLANYIEKVTAKNNETDELAFEQKFNWHIKIYSKFGGRRLEYVDDKSEILVDHIDLRKP